MKNITNRLERNREMSFEFVKNFNEEMQELHGTNIEIKISKWVPNILSDRLSVFGYFDSRDYVDFPLFGDRIKTPVVEEIYSIKITFNGCIYTWKLTITSKGFMLEDSRKSAFFDDFSEIVANLKNQIELM